MQTITVRHNDGNTSSATVTPTVQVAFERHFKCGITVMADAATLRMEHMYWLAWHACTAGQAKRQGFDDWLATVEEIEHNDAEADDADPLEMSPLIGGSLPSPSSPVPG